MGFHQSCAVRLWRTQKATQKEIVWNRNETVCSCTGNDNGKINTSSACRIECYIVHNLYRSKLKYFRLLRLAVNMNDSNWIYFIRVHFWPDGQIAHRSWLMDIINELKKCMVWCGVVRPASDLHVLHQCSSSNGIDVTTHNSQLMHSIHGNFSLFIRYCSILYTYCWSFFPCIRFNAQHKITSYIISY